MEFSLFLFLGVPTLFGFATLRVLLEQKYGFFDAKRPLWLLQLSSWLVVLGSGLNYVWFDSPLGVTLGNFYLRKPLSEANVFLIGFILLCFGVSPTQDQPVPRAMEAGAVA